MAFETLGLNLIVQGAATFARDIGYVNSSMIRYLNSMNQYQNKIVQIATRESTIADRRVASSLRMYDQLSRGAQKYYQMTVDIGGKLYAQQTKIINSSITKGIPSASLTTREIDLNNKVLAIRAKILAIQTAGGVPAQNMLDREKLLTDKLIIVREKILNVTRAANAANNTLLSREIELANKLVITKAKIASLTSAGRAIPATLITKEIAQTAELVVVRTKLAAIVKAGSIVNQTLLDREITLQNALNSATSGHTAIVSQQAAQLVDLTNKTTEAAKAQANLVSVQSSLKSVGDILKSVLSVLSGDFGTNVISSTALGAALTKLVPQAAALSFVLDIVKISIDAANFAIKLFVGALKLIWNIISTTITFVYNLVKAIGTYLWNAIVNIAKVIGNVLVSALKTALDWFKKIGQAVLNIATLPFQAIIGFFQNLGTSIQRIVEYTIGMGFDRILWGVGEKLRYVANMAKDAGISFQLLQIRLRGLIQREMSETKGIPFNKSLAEATRRAKELSWWISELAVKSIFNAESIASLVSLGMSYDMTETEVKTLTTSIVKFATQMGLGDQEMIRIIENMGQMKAVGKMTGTELRDLARGAFVPINRVFKVMAEMPEVAKFGVAQFKVLPEYAKKSAKELILLENSGKKVYEALGKAAISWQELREMGRTGDIPAELFMKAFIKMTENDFPNAIEDASASMTAITSNIEDFIQTVIGWSVVTPIIDIVSKRMKKFTDILVGKQSRNLFESIGLSLVVIVEKFFAISDAVSPDMGAFFLKWLGQVEALLKFVAIAFKNLAPGNLNLRGLIYYVEQNQDTLGVFFEPLIKALTWMSENENVVNAILTDPIKWIRENGVRIIQDLAVKGFELLKTKAGEAFALFKGFVDKNGPDFVNSITDGVKGALIGLQTFIQEKFGKDNYLYSFVDTVQSAIEYVQRLFNFSISSSAGKTPGEPIFDPNSGVPSFPDAAPSNVGLIASLMELEAQLIKLRDKVLVSVQEKFIEFKDKAIIEITKQFELWRIELTKLTDEYGPKVYKWLSDNVPLFEKLSVTTVEIGKSIEMISISLTNLLEAIKPFDTMNGKSPLVKVFDMIFGPGIDMASVQIRIASASIGSMFNAITAFINAFNSMVPLQSKFGADLINLIKLIFSGDNKTSFLDIMKKLFDPSDPSSAIGITIIFYRKFVDEILRLTSEMKRELVDQSIIPKMMEAVKNSINGVLDIIIAGLPARINAIIAEFQRLYDALVGHSIVPDMMAGIQDSIVNTLNDTIDKLPALAKSMSNQFKDMGFNGKPRYPFASALSTNTSTISNTTNNYNLNVNSTLSSNDLSMQYNTLRSLAV
jgi:hypothetical protein